MHISAKTDYAVRALLILASHSPHLVKVEVLTEQQGLPRKFVEVILSQLRRAGLVSSQRGANGGYALALPADEITIGAIIRVVDGPLAEVRGLRPHETAYTGVAEHLPDVWVAMRSALRGVLDEITLQHVLTGALPPHVQHMAQDPDAWSPR